MEEIDSSSSSSSSNDDIDTVTMLEGELRSAVCSDDVDVLLLDLNSLSMQCRDENDVKHLVQTAFLASAEQGKTRCLSGMMDSTSSKYFTVNDTDNQGDSALILAARGNHEQAIKLLLSLGANIFLRNNIACTALDVACERGHQKSVQTLLSHALDCKARNVYGGAGFRKYLYTGLTTATEYEQVDVVKIFLDAGVDVNMNLNLETGTPLHCAIEADNSALVSMFLMHGVNVEAVRRSHLQTPLMLACQLGHFSQAQQLLQHGAEVNRQTEECSSALTLACHFGHVDVVKLLIEHGGNVNQRNRWGYNPLFMGTDSADIMEVLLAAGAEPDVACGDRDERPLHLAAVVGCAHATQLLLKAGANINVQTNEKETALWLAVWKGHAHIAKLLIQHNIDLDTPSNACQVYHWDYLPLEVAIGQGHFDIMRMLLLAGCSSTNSVYFGNTDKGHLQDIPWLRLRPEPLGVLQQIPDQLNIAKSILCHPGSLRHICRLYVRKCLGTNIAKKIKILELPLGLKGYLLFSDL